MEPVSPSSPGSSPGVSTGVSPGVSGVLVHPWIRMQLLKVTASGQVRVKWFSSFFILLIQLYFDILNQTVTVFLRVKSIRYIPEHSLLEWTQPLCFGAYACTKTQLKTLYSLIIPSFFGKIHPILWKKSRFWQNLSASVCITYIILPKSLIPKRNPLSSHLKDFPLFYSRTS